MLDLSADNGFESLDNPTCSSADPSAEGKCLPRAVKQPT
jgi:hypothetical protein